MPFITQERRTMIALNGITEQELEPGDRCYKYYLRMIQQWRDKPTWTTADAIYRWVKKAEYDSAIAENDKNQRAKELAWQVFFQLRVMPYEQIKLNQNGDIQ